VVECHLAKVDVDGSNPFARSIYYMDGGIAKWLRQRSAKPLFPGSNPGAASKEIRGYECHAFVPPFYLYGPYLGIDLTNNKGYFCRHGRTLDNEHEDWVH
jgi:hypothetical protein